MQPTKQHRETASDLDRKFRRDQHVAVLVSESDENTHARWYARVLTALTITAAGEEIIWAQMQFRDEGTGEVFFTVLTAQAVILGHATGVKGDSPKVDDVRAIGRKALALVEVKASTAIDENSSSAHAWPGDVQIYTEYLVPEKQGKQVVLFVAYEKQSNQETEHPLLRLLAELQKDLNS
ncbi:hypothetical protein [Microbacterium sp. LMC-P-041]|uniref:hypothetical protein n=1 Tax=Microbacterium sp. LMC-P-041 TaxID=3040293 RepID=UPI002555CC1E|nr:hypothetical protein [Microbacterium sp. LMC-P-041]